MDGQIWYNLYKKKWSRGMKLEGQINLDTVPVFFFYLTFIILPCFIVIVLQLDPFPFTKDWYGNYKQHVVADVGTCKKVACVDLGSFSCKFAVVDRSNSSIVTSSIESVVALV